MTVSGLKMPHSMADGHLVSESRIKGALVEFWYAVDHSSTLLMVLFVDLEMIVVLW